jgi:HD-GYP domain-containing protein (c-di-GMP phosphodiesterase class II)
MSFAQLDVPNVPNVHDIISIANAIGARDPYTKGHARRVGIYAVRLAKALKLPGEQIEQIGVGGMLHDIGKIALSDRIFSEERIHLSNIKGTILDCVQYHHERIDGTGYPYGLTDTQIPIAAKIISVADCFDAITSDRSYQKGKDKDDAFVILEMNVGTFLSSKLVTCFCSEINKNGILKA